MDHVYRIRNKKTGLFYTGHTSGEAWKKGGKFYKRISDVKNAIIQKLGWHYDYYSKNKIPNEWTTLLDDLEIITYEISEPKESGSLSGMEVYAEHLKKNPRNRIDLI